MGRTLTVAEQREKERAARMKLRNQRKISRSKARTKHAEDVAKVRAYADRYGYQVRVFNKKPASKR